MNHGYGRYGKSFRFFSQGLILRAALKQGERAQDDKDNDREKEKAEKATLAGLRLLVKIGCHKNLFLPCLHLAEKPKSAAITAVKPKPAKIAAAVRAGNE
jgi:hypothetical protein